MTGGDAIARINGEEITMAMLEENSSTADQQAMYDAKRQALERYIVDSLIEAEAEKRGMSKDDLFKTEVDEKVNKPTAEEIQAFYTANQAQMQGQTLEQISPRIEQHLTQQAAAKSAQEFVEALKTAAGVKVILAPKRVEVPERAGVARYGSPEAAVQIIEFSDFQCPYCTRGAKTIDEVKAKYGDKVSVTFRHFPLDFHKEAPLAAQAAECAGDQGKFWEYHDQLFANQRALQPADLPTYASAIGLNMAEFQGCLDSGSKKAIVDADLAAGKKVGMSGTPGFYINGEVLSGAQPLPAFVEVIDRQLAMAESGDATEAAPGVLALVNGQPITMATLDEKGSMADRKALHDAKRQALDRYIIDTVVDQAAAARGVTEEELFKAEVDGKMVKPTAADIEAFYTANQAQMQGQSLEQISPRIEQHLTQQAQGKRGQEFMEELKAAAKVEVLLPAFKMEVPARADAARSGSADAPIEIIEFSDFQCPYCTRGSKTIEEVKAKYGDKVTVVFRHFPLDFHKEAHLAAQASECAKDQGKFWEYHDVLFANQSALKPADLVNHASTVGLDVEVFNTCLDSGSKKAAVDGDLATGKDVGMTGTPGFYINGEVLSGAQPLEAFVEVIDRQLAN